MDMPGLGELPAAPWWGHREGCLVIQRNNGLGVHTKPPHTNQRSRSGGVCNLRDLEGFFKRPIKTGFNTVFPYPVLSFLVFLFP